MQLTTVYCRAADEAAKAEKERNDQVRARLLAYDVVDEIDRALRRDCVRQAKVQRAFNGWVEHPHTTRMTLGRMLHERSKES